MRKSQIAIFGIGVAAFIASAFGIGKDFGETLFNTGIAFILIDVVCLQLWPTAKHT